MAIVENGISRHPCACRRCGSIEALVIVALLAACKPEQRPPPTTETATGSARSPSGAFAAPPATIAVKVTTNGTVFPLAYGTAKIGRFGMSVMLSDRELSCASTTVEGANGVSILIPHGPHYFTGKPLAIAPGVYARDVKREIGSRIGAVFDLESGEATVELAAFEPRAGARVAGTIRFESKGMYATESEPEPYATKGDSAFAVTLCEPDVPLDLPTIPEDVLDGNVRGVVGGHPFEARSALALLSHEKQGDYDEIFVIELFAEPGIRCGTSVDPPVISTQIFGADSKHHFVGVPLPAAFLDAGMSWVEFDNLEFRVGATIRGRIYAAGLPQSREAERITDLGRNGRGGSYAGHFEAIVCNPPKGD